VEPAFASQGGPSFANASGADGTEFPLLQTTMIYDDRRAEPDADVNAASAAAVFDGGKLTIDEDAFENAYVASAGTWSDPNLEWTRAGYWATGGGWWDYDDTVGRHGVFVAGYETPAAAVPVTGSATYTGTVRGFVLHPGVSPGTTHCACVIPGLFGEASFTADFGARTVAGSLTNMWTGDWNETRHERWNDVAFTSNISGNAFSGSTRVTSAPGGTASLTGSATGTIEGKFFGPSAQEAGAVWTLFDGTRAAIGTLSGKRP